MRVEPYIFFNGRCEEALAHYQQALGATVEMCMKYGESPEKPQFPLPPGWDNKVMHCSMRIGDTVVMASDGASDCSTGNPVNYDGISLSLSVANVASAQKMFDALAASGQITMPLVKTFWAPGFGMVKDKFGVHWMLNAEAE